MIFTFLHTKELPLKRKLCIELRNDSDHAVRARETFRGGSMRRGLGKGRGGMNLPAGMIKEFWGSVAWASKEGHSGLTVSTWYGRD